MTNTAKPQLTHFFKNTFSKALTLALSLLMLLLLLTLSHLTKMPT
ncbi:hypothetical protein BAZOLSSOX_101 [uncultured Gammaproteobacteria bacterium]|nr:hypothetical protein [uncultured Gammaproteobacteria bacterium]VVH60844.1 hypothetical protein BAZOLSSOX_101 [uncultured Gammaproteobacteria bacterium]